MAIYSPDRFRADWYGWTTNQGARFGVAVVLTTMGTIGLFLGLGEYPVRLHLGAAMIAFYVLYEVATQARADGSKDWLDILEDTVWWGYGVTFVLWPLHEVARHSPTLAPDFAAFATVFSWVAFHALCGALIRIVQRCREKA